MNEHFAPSSFSPFFSSSPSFISFSNFSFVTPLFLLLLGWLLNAALLPSAFAQGSASEISDGPDRLELSGHHMALAAGGLRRAVRRQRGRPTTSHAGDC